MPTRDDAAEDPTEMLRARFREREAELPTGRWARMWRTGRSAAGVAGAVLGGKLRGRGDGLASAEVQAIATLTARLGELKGIAMKGGQLLGYLDPTLPAELRELLSVLQTQSPASPWVTIEETLLDAFGPDAWTLLAAITPTPVAVASIGQVHHGTLPDGQQIAVKVRHPGIAEALRSDFSNATIGAAFARLMPGGSSVRGMMDEARTAMLEECDLSLEASRQRSFGGWFADHPTLIIPPTLDAWCAPAVLTTHWHPGRTLDAFLAGSPSQAARDRVGEALFELFVGALYRHHTFHADPHPGNLAITEDGHVVIYDFGCVRQFAPATVDALAALLAAVREDDADAIEAALIAIGGTPPHTTAGRAHLRTLLRGFFAPLLVAGPHAIDPGGALEASALVRDKRALIGLALPGSLLFLLRLRFGLYAVLARLGAVVDWSALESQWAARTGASTRASPGRGG